VVIAPQQGPPGTTIRISAAGFDAHTDIQIGAGPEDAEFVVRQSRQSDAQGRVETELIIPEMAEPATRWIIVARAIAPDGERATSGAFNVVADAAAAHTPTPTRAVDETERANADVTYVRAVRDAGGTWTFHVTVEHPDTGWEDYADGWDVVTPEGEVLKPDPDSAFTRTLLHPHENEQPFTRSQRGIDIPERVTQVRVRAHDLVDGFGGREVLVDLTADGGADFAVER
jgi:hypothetical protein